MSKLTSNAGRNMLLLAAGLAGFLLWAALFQIDQGVRAQGQLIPAARTQLVQAVDGGVLARLLVEEGQVVQAGQRLAVLDSERPGAALDESRAKAAALAAALARAEAEASGRTPRFAEQGEFGQFATVQLALYAQRQRSLREELAPLEAALGLAGEELSMHEALFAAGDTSRLELMRSQRQRDELQGRIDAVRNRYLSEARQEAVKLADELVANRYRLEDRRSVLGHTELLAPVAGIVKYLKVNTIGAVLRPGDELLQISPTDGSLQLEIKLNPADIGQIHLGLPVSVRFDAFDPSLYGSLQGQLVYVSADTLTEQAGAGMPTTYYRARVALAPQQDNRRLLASMLRPGMNASVDIRTGTRSVLYYLVKPISKGFDGALRER